MMIEEMLVWAVMAERESEFRRTLDARLALAGRTAAEPRRNGETEKRRASERAGWWARLWLSD
jgi:hypothetical protein